MVHESPASIVAGANDMIPTYNNVTEPVSLLADFQAEAAINESLHNAGHKAFYPTPTDQLPNLSDLFDIPDDHSWLTNAHSTPCKALESNQNPSWCSWAVSRVSLTAACTDSQPTLHASTAGTLVANPNQAHANAGLVLQSLRSLPTMMLRRETFPWFIHAHCYPRNPTGLALPDPLVFCMATAQMFTSRT